MDAKDGLLRLMIDHELQKLNPGQVEMSDNQVKNPSAIVLGANEFAFVYFVKVAANTAFTLTTTSAIEIVEQYKTPTTPPEDIYFNDITLHRGLIEFSMSNGDDYWVHYVIVRATGEKPVPEIEKLLRQIAEQQYTVIIDNKVKS